MKRFVCTYPTGPSSVGYLVFRPHGCVLVFDEPDPRGMFSRLGDAMKKAHDPPKGRDYWCLEMPGFDRHKIRVHEIELSFKDLGEPT